MILPAVPSLEKEGTFTNTERRIQRLYQSLEPVGESRPDWRIISDIAAGLGYDWGYESPADIMHEAASLAPLFAGVRYERMEGYNSLQWPVAEDGTDTPLLYVEDFPFPDGKAKFYPLAFNFDYETDEEYDLHVNNGRVLEHFHEGNMTYKSPAITSKLPSAFIEISPELAKERGINEGGEVKLISRTGEVTGSIHITDRVRGRELYLPLNDNGKTAINYLTDNSVDKDTNTPAYKEVAVKMEVIKKKGKSPLPPNNYRRGNPQPQIGVRVEKKWQRNDYTFPKRQVKHHG